MSRAQRTTGDPWCASVPTDWDYLPLRRLGLIVGGGTPTADEANWGGEVPFVTPPDLRPVVGSAVMVTERSITPEVAHAASSMVPAGTVLVSIRAPIGYVARTVTAVAFNQGCRALVPSSGMDTTYLTYALVAATPELVAQGRGTTFMEVSGGQFAATHIPVPPTSEQRAIAALLDRETSKVDALINEAQSLVRVLRERRAAVIAQATGWAALPPRQWTWKRLSWLFGSTGSGTTPAPEDIVGPEAGTIPWVTTGELRESMVTSTRKAVTSDSLAKYSALKVHPAGSLLIAMYGATIGRMGILGVAAASNQACCALIGPRSCVTEFVQYSLQAAREHLLLDAAGGGQPNINQDKVRSFRIPVPSVQEQRQIVQTLDEQTQKIDALIAEAEGMVAVAIERRAALITAAVTGQIDVRGEVA